MSYRATEVQEASVQQQVSSANRLISDRGLPVGFAWQEGVTSQGEPTLNVVHVASGRIVIYGD